MGGWEGQRQKQRNRESKQHTHHERVNKEVVVTKAQEFGGSTTEFVVDSNSIAVLHDGRDDGLDAK